MERQPSHQFKHGLFGLFNRPYISSELSAAQRPLIIHVSDTPRLSYPFLYRIVRVLEPEYLIHTGDLVDDIKLEIRPQEIGSYRRELAKFLGELERTPARRIYLVPGNHDLRELLETYGPRCTTVAEHTTLEIEDLRVTVSHKYDAAHHDADVYLFGHTPSPRHHESGKTVCLNGISSISVIEVPSRRLHALPYPVGTDSVRKMLLPKPGL
ncbi:MAG: metallophosphoesterase [Spirochaetota bacterium]